MRVKGPSSRKFKKKILKLAKGFRGKRKNVYRRAKEYVFRALQYQYRDRRQRKKGVQKALDSSYKRSGKTTWYFLQ